MTDRYSAIAFLAVLLIVGSSLSFADNTRSTPPQPPLTGNEQLHERYQAEAAPLNHKLRKNRELLRELHAQVSTQWNQKGDTEEYRSLLRQLEAAQAARREIIQEWKAYSTTQEKDKSEYRIWKHDELSLADFVIEFGDRDVLYIIPDELQNKKIRLQAQVPIPNQLWAEALEWILRQQGIGIRSLEGFVKELYVEQKDWSDIAMTVTDPSHLAQLAPQLRVCLVLAVPLEMTNRFIQMLTHWQGVIEFQLSGQQALLVARNETLQQFLRLYRLLSDHPSQLDYIAVTLKTLLAQDMQQILNHLFPSLKFKGTQTEQGTLGAVIPLNQDPHTLCVVGPTEYLEKARAVIQTIENTLWDEKHHAVFWYTCKYSRPEELAQVLSHIYQLMKGHQPNKRPIQEAGEVGQSKKSKGSPPEKPKKKELPYIATESFVVDSKTSSLVIVVEREFLPKLQQMIRKLDVPKKMVEIEVMILEKKAQASQSFGMNYLNLGSKSSQGAAGNGGSWLPGKGDGKGILALISKPARKGRCAFDLAFSLLCYQEQTHINANPTITTINQTPATIEIMREISLDQGAIMLESSQKKEAKYVRREYGIRLQITPTIHAHELDESSSVTLQTEIAYDDISDSSNERPQVSRNKIINEVRMESGETLILGGLRRKRDSKKESKIPFLGDIPGLGKLFSYEDKEQQEDEMMIFLTPRVVSSEREQRYKEMTRQLQARPGDTPAFLETLAWAQSNAQKQSAEKKLSRTRISAP